MEVIADAREQRVAEVQVQLAVDLLLLRDVLAEIDGREVHRIRDRIGGGPIRVGGVQLVGEL